jgi:IS30 family transposase
MDYQHLAVHERYQIFTLKKAGLSISAIACQLNRHRCTIYRELKRNLELDQRVLEYSPSRAHALAHSRKLIRAHRRRIAKESWDEIDFAVNEMNHRPRKTLGFRTPHALFFA